MPWYLIAVLTVHVDGSFKWYYKNVETDDPATAASDYMLELRKSEHVTNTIDVNWRESKHDNHDTE